MRNKLQLQAIPFFLLLQHTTCCEDLICSVDYLQTLTCIQKTDLGGTLYNLTATWILEEEMKSAEHTCNLLQSSRTATHTQYVCFMDLMEFSADDKFRVDVTKLTGGQYTISKACNEFIVKENIKPSPPFNLTATFSDGYNISWETLYQNALSYYLNDELQYELRYKKRSDSWEHQKSKVIPEDKRSVMLLSLEFQSDTDYEFQVRAKPRPDSGYLGFWSEWSPLLTLRTEPEEITGVRWLVVLFAFALVTVSITVFLTKHQSIWKKLGVFIPDPAPFFRPLYMIHNGDFKKWVGASCTKATLDFFEWGIVLPEVLEVYSKHVSHNTSEELKELNKNPHFKPCVSCLAVHGQNSPSHLYSLNRTGGTQDQSYGHLSIDTVTVADEFMPCYPQCDCDIAHRGHEHLNDKDDDVGEEGYPKINLDGGNSEIALSLPLAALSAQDKIISSGSVSAEHSWRSASPSVHRPMEEAFGGGMGSILEALCLHPEQWDLESPTSLPSPDGESVSYSDGPYDFFSSKTRTGDGYPATCLDLDTIDSGFVDSDCGSPTECEFEKSSQSNSGCSSGSITLEKEGEDFPRSYVKQWVSCSSATPPSGTQTN